MPQVYEKQRRHERYACDVGVEIRNADSGSAYWGTLADISLGGCYVNSFSPLPQGTSVILLIKPEAGQINVKGVTVSFHPGMGMGIAFMEFMSPDDEMHLKNLIGRYAEQKAAAAGA
jgi:PilZ domain-containing protein